MNKYLILIILIFSVTISNCEFKTCDCRVDNSNQLKNDSLINELKTIYKEQTPDYWDFYDEPKLFDLKHKSYRFREKNWMAGLDKIYRISKVNYEYYLYYKEYTDQTESLNRFGTGDSLIIYYEIPLKDSLVWKIDMLYESNCFWTHPIKKSEKKIVLHPKTRFLEIFDPKLNICTQKDYHYVEMIGNNTVEFEAIIQDFEVIVENYALKK